MSLNTAHHQNGMILYSGEGIILYAKNVVMEIDNNNAPEFKGSKVGNMILTTHRLIFINDKKNDPLLSFSLPFVALSDLGLEQPILGANYIKARVTSQENGNWTGTAKIKLTFKNGGACDFGSAIFRLSEMVKKYNYSGPPPPYSAPSAPMYQAPPPAYTPNPDGYYGWIPPRNVFPDVPSANQVYMVDTPPPYYGIHGMQTNPYAGASCPTAPPSAADSKAAEAAQSAYYDPNKPGFAYVPPPPPYSEYPPSYQQATAKKDQ